MSKKVFNVFDLSLKIDEDVIWRRKELKIILDLVQTSIGPKKDAALRFAIPILYAHWEGFVKRSCELYLEFVANKYKTHRELKPQFIALSLTKKLGALEIKNIVEKAETIDFLINEFEKRANIPVKNIIQTKSNLKYYVFEEIIYILGLDTYTFDKYKDLIDSLVDTRNHIAHGSYLKVTEQTYVDFNRDIDSLMSILKTEIENSAVMEGYLKSIKPPFVVAY